MTTTSSHPHEWHIARPNGPTSPGVCQICGEQRDFLNSLPYPRYGNMTAKESRVLAEIRKAAEEEWYVRTVD